MGAQDMAVLDERHPNLDSWLYRLDLDEGEFGAVAATGTVGTRTVHLMVVENGRVYRKWDRTTTRGFQYFDGARDKVAADLAQTLGICIPATLLWVQGADHGCVQKEPPHFTQPVEKVLRGFKVRNEGWIVKMLADAYDPMNLFFDTWVCNRDRSSNANNLLLAENDQTVMVWLIDYNSSLGHVERPWTERHNTEHGFDPGDPPPIPPIVLRDSDWVEKFKALSDDFQRKLEELDDETIDEVCTRAFGFYGENDRALGTQMAECLKRRRQKVKDWTWELLAS